MITLKKQTYDINTLEGCASETYVLTTEDGVQLNLTRYYRSTSTTAVLLLHGLSSSSEMFLGHEFHNLTYYMLTHGVEDVWLLDWRSSCVYDNIAENSDHTVEDVAMYDIPAAVKFIQAKVSNGLHLVCHCIGAMSLSMALASQQIEGLKSAALCSVSLFPRLNAGSLLKLYTMPELSTAVLDIDHFVVDPDHVDFRDGSMLLLQGANLSQNQCDNPTCRMLSFIWGSGHESTLFCHENLDTETHDKLNQYLGPVSLSYFKHIRKMLQHNAVVSVDGKINYLDKTNTIDTPLLIALGSESRCWYDSNKVFSEMIDAFFPDVTHELSEIPGYSHIDMFIGKNAHSDVFPEFIDFIERHN